MHSLGVNPYIRDWKIWPKETRNISLPYGASCLFWYLRTVSEWSTCVTDGRTDILAYSIMLRFTMPSAETPSSVHWRRFYFQLTRVHSALELFGRCALQTYLLTYLLTYWPSKEGESWWWWWHAMKQFAGLILLWSHHCCVLDLLCACVWSCGNQAIIRRTLV